MEVDNKQLPPHYNIKLKNKNNNKNQKLKSTPFSSKHIGSFIRPTNDMNKYIT